METSFRKSKTFLFAKKYLVLLGIVLLVGIFSISNTLKKEVLIQDEGKEIVVKGFVFTVEDVLKKADIALSENDQCSVTVGDKVTDGMKITIKRAYPLTIQVDGEAVEVMTAHDTVADILQQYSIPVSTGDRVEPSLEATVERNSTIYIKRMKEEIVVEKRIVPYERVIKYNDKLDKGKLMVLQRGKDGEKEVEYKILYEDGREISREIIGERIIAPSQNEVVEQGTAQYIATSRGSVRYTKTLKMSATAYDASFESTGKNPGDPYYGITRSGTKVRPGVVAVDPKVIPLGTKLYIKSLDGSKDYGFASAEDTGGAIKGHKIDLYFEDSKDVRKFGRRNVQVYILD